MSRGTWHNQKCSLPLQAEHPLLHTVQDLWTSGTNFISLIASLPVKESGSVPGLCPSISLDLWYPVSYQLSGPSQTADKRTLLIIIPSCWWISGFYVNEAAGRTLIPIVETWCTSRPAMIAVLRFGELKTKVEEVKWYMDQQRKGEPKKYENSYRTFKYTNHSAFIYSSITDILYISAHLPLQKVDMISKA